MNRRKYRAMGIIQSAAILSILLLFLQNSSGAAVRLGQAVAAPDGEADKTGVGFCGPHLMEQVQVLPGGATAFHLHTKLDGLDFDQDGLREFVRAKQLATTFSFDFFESVADNTFQPVHSLDIAASFRDAGDADEDGLMDMLITDSVGNQTFVHVYESATTGSYPDEIVWESVVGTGIARYGDTDGDGAQEIIVFGRPESSNDYHLIVFENDGNNAFVEIFNELLTGVIGAMQLTIADDLDKDGRGEILISGSMRGGKVVIALESTGDNAFSWVWSELLTHGGEQVNPKRIVDGGDLDGDGRNEFLVGGLKANSSPSALAVHLFEVVADDWYEVVFTFLEPYGTLESSARVAVADVDGDGKKEIVLGSGSTVKIFRNDGDNLWSEWWSTTAENLWSIGAGDHDNDGKDELVIGAGIWPDGETAVWEVRPQCAADFDGDSVVDAIDNCPTDSNPNQDDGDGDGAGDLCDCLPQDGTVFDDPQEIQGVRWPTGTVLIEWTTDAPNSGTSTVYDVLQGELDNLPVGGVGEVCLDPDTPDTSSDAISTPSSGAGFYYLIRGENACGIGTYGTDSSLNLRISTACP